MLVRKKTLDSLRKHIREAEVKHLEAQLAQEGLSGQVRVAAEMPGMPMQQEVEEDTGGGATKRAIPKNYSYDPNALKPLAEVLWAMSIALGHAMTAHRKFTKVKSSTISPDGLLGGRGYVMSVKDIRKALYDACEAISAVSDTIHDEINAPHWKPKLAEMEMADKDSVERLVGDAEKNLDNPEADIEEDMTKAEQAGNPVDLSDPAEADESEWAQDPNGELSDQPALGMPGQEATPDSTDSPMDMGKPDRTDEDSEFQGQPSETLSGWDPEQEIGVDESAEDPEADELDDFADDGEGDLGDQELEDQGDDQGDMSGDEPEEGFEDQDQGDDQEMVQPEDEDQGFEDEDQDQDDQGEDQDQGFEDQDEDPSGQDEDQDQDQGFEGDQGDDQGFEGDQSDQDQGDQGFEGEDQDQSDQGDDQEMAQPEEESDDSSDQDQNFSDSNPDALEGDSEDQTPLDGEDDQAEASPEEDDDPFAKALDAYFGTSETDSQQPPAEEAGNPMDEDEDEDEDPMSELPGGPSQQFKQAAANVLKRFANSSVPVETLSGPRVQHLDRGDVDQTGPFGSYNKDEPQSMKDQWSKDDGAGSDATYKSEWENMLNRTASYSPKEVLTAARSIVRQLQDGVPERQILASKLSASFGFTHKDLSMFIAMDAKGELKFSSSMVPNSMTDPTPTEGWDFGLGFGARGQGAGGYGTKGPDGKEVWGPASQLPKDPAGKSHDYSSSDTTPKVEREVGNGKSAFDWRSQSSLPQDVAPKSVARSDYYEGQKDSNMFNTVRGESELPDLSRNDYDSPTDSHPGFGERWEQGEQPYVKWDSSTKNMRTDDNNQRDDEGPYVRNG